MTPFSKAENLADCQPLQIVLGRVSDEARQVTEDLALLDRAISRAVALAGAEELEDLQKADSLRQRLEGMSRFLEALAQAMKPEVMCNPVLAAQKIPMRAQAQRLALLPPNASQSPDRDSELWEM